MASKEDEALIRIREEMVEKKNAYLSKRDKGLIARWFPTDADKAEDANHLETLKKEFEQEQLAIEAFNKAKIQAFEAILEAQVSKVRMEQRDEVSRFLDEKISGFRAYLVPKKTALNEEMNKRLDMISKISHDGLRNRAEKDIYVEIDTTYAFWANELSKLISTSYGR